MKLDDLAILPWVAFMIVNFEKAVIVRYIVQTYPKVIPQKLVQLRDQNLRSSPNICHFLESFTTPITYQYAC